MNMIENRLKNEIVYNMSPTLRGVVSGVELENVQEVRIRAGQPLMISKNGINWFVTRRGDLSKTDTESFVVSREEVIKTLELVCQCSIYAVQSDLAHGFVTIAGGHRVGIAGKTVVADGQISHIKDVSGLNFRIAHEIKGAANKIIDFIDKPDGVKNTLIISPPQCGKTTMLRDITRILSNKYKIGVVDERSEIAACYKGVAQFDLGVQTDVLDSCPKSSGMIMMTRSMSPDVIVTDEIGLEEDILALKQVINAGVKVITSVHGYSREDVERRALFRELYEMFDLTIVLSNRIHTGMIEEIYYTDKAGTYAYA